jgi:hypothetical protein
MGVIDFILSSDVDAATRKKGLVLAPLDALPRADTGSASNVDGGDPPEADNASIEQIEDCCRLWRAGMVTPEWFPMLDSIFGTSMSPFADLCEIYLKRHHCSEHGCAVRIKLSSHSFRVYSSEPGFSTPAQAKKACADEALQQGVFDYIKFGNGQSKPAGSFLSVETSIENQDTPAAATPITLQQFYESLPQPFPEHFGNQSAIDINASVWMNVTTQSAKGARFNIVYVWTTAGTPACKGCL